MMLPTHRTAAVVAFLVLVVSPLAAQAAPAAAAAEAQAPGPAETPAASAAPAEAAVPAAPGEPRPAQFLADQAFSLGFRLGTVIWSGLTMPAADASKPGLFNGINGKNWLYPDIPTMGVVARIGLGPALRLGPSLSVSFDEYLYRADLGRAFRTQSMTGSQLGPVATTLGLIVEVPFWFDIPLDRTIVLSLAPGLAAYPRIAVAAIDGSTGIEKITEYLNADAKWLYPFTAVGVRYSPTGSAAVSAELAVYYPLYHVWSTDGLGFEDGFMVLGRLGMDFYF